MMGVGSRISEQTRTATNQLRPLQFRNARISALIMAIHPKLRRIKKPKPKKAHSRNSASTVPRVGAHFGQWEASAFGSSAHTDGDVGILTAALKFLRAETEELGQDLLTKA
jgi:hypothetical protein